ncbi:MAG: transcriptional regulator NrdR [Hirschia sp.]|nr:transcriptional regulator NrdR [Hirschia sp.]MBF19896.1 transcriptional regulator NrdR [Hirschia sp.]
MRCPFCQSSDTVVRDSRPAEEDTAVRRRRVCQTCGARFTTFERVQLRELVVVKRGGKKAQFEREKLVRSIQIALQKRPVSEEQIDQMVSGIIRRLESAVDGEVESREIGGMVMEALAALDPVGYVRYASVYRDFKDASDFARFIESQIVEIKEGDGELE